MGGQIRVGAFSVVGWDMTAALAMAGALGVPLHLVAEVLPEIEAVFVAAVNERIGEDKRDG